MANSKFTQEGDNELSGSSEEVPHNTLTDDATKRNSGNDETKPQILLMEEVSIRKSVSWAEDTELVEIYEIESAVDKMSDFNTEEKLSIRNSGKSLKRYGSTCNHVKRPEYFITHIVKKTDTLQGLALKYNTSTEQIRRVNRLFACDSLFLRESLKIPVPKEIADTIDKESNHSSSGSTSESGTVTSSISTESYSDDEQKLANDFLCKIDSSIASTRAQVKHVQQHSNFVDPNDVTMTKRRNRRQNADPIESVSASQSDIPQPVVLSQSRKVRNSLQRLEKEQDDLFEL